MAELQKVKILKSSIAGISLVLILSGCGKSQASADKACQEFKNKNYEATSKAFSELARKNPAYMDQATDAFTLLEYLNDLKQWKKDYEVWKADQKKPAKPQSRMGVWYGWKPLAPTPPDPKAAEEAIRNLQIFCK